MASSLSVRIGQWIWRAGAAQLCGVLLVGVSFAQVDDSYYVDGDPIGADSSTTDNTGGFTAVQQLGVNMGQPAIFVSLGEDEIVTEFRVIVFGIATVDGNLLFNQFDYRLDVWESDDYFAGSEPQYRVELGQPSNVNYVSDGPSSIVPDVQFGTAGAGGGNAPTYDFRFDLTQTPMVNLLQGAPCVLDSALSEGEWVFGFQSWHDTADNGILRVSGAAAEEGPVPLFSRDGSVPRGVLGGQDPDNIVLYWGMSLTAASEDSLNYLVGDFDGNGVVDAADYTVWRDNLGAATESSLNNNGDGVNGVDSGDYNLWHQNFNLLLCPPIMPNNLAGDFNGDGVVDAADYTVWRDNLGAATESSLSNNGDGKNGVDVGDYELWRQNFGGVFATEQSNEIALPEPASLILLVIAGGGILLRRT